VVLLYPAAASASRGFTNGKGQMAKGKGLRAKGKMQIANCRRIGYNQEQCRGGLTARIEMNFY
jgi:hypothetical protein